MLDLFRRKRQGLKWVLWLVIIGLTAGMVLLFVDTPSGVSQGLNSQNIAQVNGETISAAEFRKHYARIYDMYRQIYRLDQQDPAIIRQLGIGQQALNQLISEYAIQAEAQRLGLTATPEEVRQRIARLPVFQENGQFIGVQRYQDLLRANNFTVPEFEENVRREIIHTKLQNVLTDAITATPEEAKQEFISRNLEVKVRYVAFDGPGSVPDEVSDADLRQYFEQNQETYRVGEQRKFRYLNVEMNPSQVQLTEEQINAALDTAAEDEQVRARHILVSFRNDAEEAQARAKAEDLLRQLRAGADFAALAREHSDDPGSAEQGGDLGFFGRGQMVPEFEDVAFTLDKGATSDLVQSPFGYHIIQVVDDNRTQIDARRPVVEFTLRQEEAARQARNRALRIYNELKSNPNLEEAARRHDLTVQETGFLSSGQPLAGIMVGPDFHGKAFSARQGEILEPYSGTAGTVIAQVDEIRDSYIPPFAEVSERVAGDYRQNRGEELARQRALDFHQAVRAGARFEEQARRAGRPMTTTGFFRKGENVDDTIRFSPDLQERAFTMNEGEVGGPVQVAGNHVVFQLVSKSEVDMEQFESEKDQLTQEMTLQKRSRFFGSYVQNVVDQLRKENKIVINQELLDAIVG
jgi:peptidyl-prolyl cis-trans isomerase D